LKLQISTQLAIFALIELVVNPDHQITVGEIGGKYGVSSHHLAKVMQVLARARLIRSIRGAGGGYQFCGNARRTTLLDVIELFEPLGSGGQDVGAPGERTNEGRALRVVMDEIDNTVRATLSSITLATMCGLVERHRWEPAATYARVSPR
jgi:Rrf2 family protein